MPDLEIPKRALFKASEVCEIASVQPYVLRSWESEFPDLGVSKGNGGPRVYRRGPTWSACSASSSSCFPTG